MEIETKERIKRPETEYAPVPFYKKYIDGINLQFLIPLALSTITICWQLAGVYANLQNNDKENREAGAQNHIEIKEHDVKFSNQQTQIMVLQTNVNILSQRVDALDEKHNPTK